MDHDRLRIALLSYRAHPEVGGQGVYVKHLAEALTDLGHRVTILAGPPYPDRVAGVDLVRMPSLDLYRPEDPFRRPRLREFGGPIDVAEYGLMCTGSFPEPLTFSLRVARFMRRFAESFDVVHDNQCLGYGLLAVAKMIPVVATIHHPISIDRRLALRAAHSCVHRLTQRRWYSFVRMQARVARRLPLVLTVSESAGEDVVSDFRVPPDRLAVVHNGVDTDLFRPLPEVARVPGRIVAVASSDHPSKGMPHLIEAIAKLRTERAVELVVIGKGGTARSVARAVERFGVADSVRTVGRIDALEMVKLYAEAEVAVVPSLYEGFSLPAVEAMSCGVPLVATTGGALTEVVGREGAGISVPPADAGALAVAIAGLLDDPQRSVAMGHRARARVMERFTWRAAAEGCVEQYWKVTVGC
ncbi:MAG: glycosyltransferase family 4 protein [Actinomycetota bacterium]